MSATDIFNVDIYTRYRVRLQVREQMTGGIPGDPSVIRKWLESRLELGDTALQELITATIAERDSAMTAEDKLNAVMQSDAAPSVNGFKRDPITAELVYEGRCMKAAIKEAANSAYPGTDWPGKPAKLRKGLMRFLAEAVTVDEQFIGLGVKEPSRVEERIKHVMTAQGPRSSINRVEVVDRPVLECTVKVRDDFLPVEAWGRIWATLEEIGVGADRGRSDGKFDLLEWTRL